MITTLIMRERERKLRVKMTSLLEPNHLFLLRTLPFGIGYLCIDNDDSKPCPSSVATAMLLHSTRYVTDPYKSHDPEIN